MHDLQLLTKLDDSHFDPMIKLSMKLAGKWPQWAYIPYVLVISYITILNNVRSFVWA